MLICLAVAGEATAQVKTLVFCSNESPDGFNPQLSLRQATFDASSRQIYDRLVTYHPGNPEIAPSLATSWEISEDGLKYEFRLRPDVPFHKVRHFTPSRPLSAADIVFSFMRQLDRRHPYHKVSGGAYPYFRGLGLSKIIKSVTAVDAGTVIFELKSPFPAFLSTLALDFASILSAEYADAMLAAETPERVDREPVGTGPFQLVQYQRDALIRYVAHQEYWRGKAPLDNLVFTIIPDATVRYQKLRDRECHVIADPDPADIPAMTLDGDVKLVRQVGIDVGYLAFNTRKPPLNDPRVRKALALAIDREAILEKIYQGIGHPAAAIIPPGLWPHGTAAAAPADPERAKRLLDEAAVFRLDLEIWPSPVARSYLPDARRTAEMIHEDWLKIGVELASSRRSSSQRAATSSNRPWLDNMMSRYSAGFRKPWTEAFSLARFWAARRRGPAPTDHIGVTGTSIACWRKPRSRRPRPNEKLCTNWRRLFSTTRSQSSP
jgi:dipeptide transport system substrate-binding protein